MGTGRPVRGRPRAAAGLALVALAASARVPGGPALEAQQPTITVTVTVPQPTSDWKAWSTNPAIAMVVLQTTLPQPIAVTSTVRLLKDGQQLGQVPGNVSRLPAGSQILRTPQMAAWSRMQWSDIGAPVADSGTLPPGTYQLCLDIVPPPPSADMAVHLMIMHRCASFTLSAPRIMATPPMTVKLPPPHLITPASRSELLLPHPTFQWTPVVSRDYPRPTYVLRIAEVLPGQTPEQALAGGRPLLDRELIGRTTFPYPASAPKLEPGTTYAWQVQALEMPRGEAGGVKPLGMNQGRSEVYTFRRPAERVARTSPAPQGPAAKSGMLYDAALSGRMMYTFQPNGVPKPRRVSTYLGPPPQGTTFEMQGQPGGRTTRGGQQGGQGAGGSQGSSGGPVHFQDAPRTDPLAGVTLRLLVHYRTEKDWVRGQTLTAGGKTYTDNGKVVATARAGDDGRFTFFYHDDLPTGIIGLKTTVSSGSGEFGFHESGVNLVRFYTVEVGDPHYASPSDELEKGQGGTGDVGTLVALVRGYTLQVRVTRAGTKATKTGLRVQLLRPFRAAGVPANEGDAPTPRSKYGLFEIIGRGVTGSDGTATFRHLVKNVGPADRYSVRVSTDPNNGNAHYYAASVPVSHPMLLGDSQGWDDAVFNEDYRSGRVYRLDVPVSPMPPEYVGTVLRADTKKPVARALMVLVQPGVGGSLILHAVKPADDGKFVIKGFQVNRKYVVYVHAPGFRPDSNSFRPDSGVATHFDHQLQPAATVTLSLVDENGTPVPGRVRVGNGAQVDAQPVYGNGQGQELRAFAGGVTWSAQGSGGASGGQQASSGQARPAGGMTRSSAGAQAQAGGTAQASRSGLVHLEAYRVTVPAASGTQTVHVDAGPDYFPTDTTMTIPRGTSDLGRTVLYLRMRRLDVKVVALKGTPASPGGGRRRSPGGMRIMHVTGGASEPPVRGAVVTLPDEPGQPTATTDAAGDVRFQWKATSPDSVEQVTVRITPPPSSDFRGASSQVPVPESRAPRTSVLGLVPGATVEGTVYAGTGSDSVVAGARVFIPEAGPGGTDLADSTDVHGHYALHGAPAGARWVWAGKAGSDFTGDSARVTAKAGASATQDFHLTAVEGLPTSLLGLSIEVQTYTKTAHGAILSGRFTDVPSNDAFTPRTKGLTLAFDSVAVTGTGKDAVPSGGRVHLDESDLPLTLYKAYLVRQHEDGGLVVEDRGQGKGAVVGPAQLLSGSFSLTTAELAFRDSLFLLGPGASGAAAARVATLEAGGASPAPAGGYGIGTAKGGDAGLTLYGFAADAAAASSRLTPKALTLDVILHTAIPGVQDLAIHVPDLTVTPGQGAGAGLQPAKGDQALSLSLGAWTLESPSWSLGKGRLHLVQGVVRVPMIQGTPNSDIDFPFTGLEVTPTALEGGSFGGGPILLGGFVPLQVKGGVTFVRDTPTGPWKLFGDGGTIAALPGMASGDVIHVQSFDFLSSGKKSFSMEPGTSVRLYGTGDLAVSNLGITESSVSFAGGLDLHVPGLDPQAVVVDYTRPASGHAPTFKFNPIDIQPFDIGGAKVSVHQGTLDASGFQGDGTVSVPGKFTVASHFTRSPLGPNQKIDALPLPHATLDVGQVAISKLQGGAKVAAGKWATNYQGHMDVGGQVSGDITIGVEGTDVTAGTGGLAVKNIPTPFGNMAITMNFPEERLEGSVQMDKDIAAGAHVKGTTEMVISGKPSDRYWYFFTGAAFSLKTPHMSGSAALLIGSATLKADLLARYAKYGRRPVPAQFHVINGFFMEGEVSIPVPICPNGAFDIGVASVEVWCNVWGDVRLGANFQQANTYFVGVGAGIDAGIKGGVGMGLCLHVAAEVKAGLDGEGAYRSDGAWYARGDANLDLNGSASYGVGLDDVCLHHTTSVHIGLGAEAQLGYDWATNVGPHAKVYFR
ncbi:MAG: hypothetical protein Q8W47_11515 [Candidatus Palauibacterales bacterium]|nr:hypothetical protein [Candidatus Palauibacterales bacterium]